MKIEGLEISNFRGIRQATLTNLGSTVVIAGANGSGKSCIFDAIRLIKSIYGGYHQQDEWQQWMSEFQIQPTDSSDYLSAILNDKTKPLQITIRFRLHPDEREYLRAEGKDLVRKSVWKIIAPELYGTTTIQAASMAAQLRARETEVNDQTDAQYESLLSELAQETLTAEFIFDRDAKVAPSKALELVFGTFLPQKLGVIDYHGPQRFFSRELVQGISLSLDANTQQNSQFSLYNYSNKYNNVKSEMASSFVKEIISERAGLKPAEQSNLTNTLAELFQSFFPDKKFLGPQPRKNGTLDFPVQTADGSTHDLNELSAGEKEILFGYLRIRNSAPKYSIILIDEPEIHLNPRLVRGLPQFYNKHLGVALDNQIWLVTHSDTILREVIGRVEYSLFHMRSAASVPKESSQTTPILAQDDIERAVINLVGDLATYLPGGKVVVFEGGGDSEFDQEFTGTLFPEFQQAANFISGGNRSRVRQLHELLQKVADRGRLPFKIYSICDHDSKPDVGSSSTSHVWDVYHIENYLLERDFVLHALQSLGIQSLATSAAVYDALREAARETLPDIIRHELAEDANTALISAISTKGDPNATNLVDELRKAVMRSAARVTEALEGPLSEESLQREMDAISSSYQDALSGDGWLKSFRGRDILKRFAGKYAPGIPYESFRNLIISRMREVGHRPLGMKTIIDQIIAD